MQQCVSGIAADPRTARITELATRVVPGVIMGLALEPAIARAGALARVPGTP